MVVAGPYHTCVVDRAGRLNCFGCNYHGQCDVPAGLSTVTSVDATNNHTAVLCADGRSVVFGDNLCGQCLSISLPDLASGN